MPDDPDRLAAFRKALIATHDQGPDVQFEGLQGYVVPQPTQAAADRLWTTLVTGLLLLIAISLIGLIVLLATKHSADVALTAFTALVTGLLGLFIKPPGSS